MWVRDDNKLTPERYRGKKPQGNTRERQQKQAGTLRRYNGVSRQQLAISMAPIRERGALTLYVKNHWHH